MLFYTSTISAAPSASPSSPVVFGTTHEFLSLNWEAPPSEHRNGVIRSYLIAVHEFETGRNFTVISDSNMTQVTLEPLHPFYTYQCSIAAETVGSGPFSEHITVQLPEAGDLHSMFSHILFRSIQQEIYMEREYYDCCGIL